MAGRIITIFGATGSQGQAIVHALLQQGGWKLRAVTRNPDSDKAKALKGRGVEVVKASFDDKVSLKAAMHGSYGVFVVTNFWEIFDAEKEARQGKDAADVAREEGVQHFVYSGLAAARKLTGISVPHYDAKGEVEDYLLTTGLPYTIIRYPFYYENLLGMFIEKQEDGTISVTTSMGKHPLYAVSVEDGGPVVAEIFRNRDEYLGKAVDIAGDYSPVDYYISVINKHTSKTFKHVEVSLTLV
jgi:uncharacterized protein YbjT (DUF2867 family)